MLSKDFKNNQQPAEEEQTRQPHWSARAILLGLGLVIIGAVFASTNSHTTRQTALVELEPAAHDTENSLISLRRDVPLPLPKSSYADAITTEQPGQVLSRSVTIQRGDSISSVFSRLEIYSQLKEILEIPEAKKILRRIQPGQVISITQKNGLLHTLTYERSNNEQLYISRNNGKLELQTQAINMETYVAVAHGTINDSLFLAGQRAGLSNNTIMELAGIFGWDIDFALDIRSGDHFSLIYEQHFRDGLKVSDGNILAAEFVNQGKIFRAIRYTDEKGRSDYYAPDGKSMRKTFLRTPVNFTRISSRFNPNRLHPIFKTKRPHRGVDYAAPTGTPVKTSGDGKIIFRGRKGGYGNVVMVQHGERYTTVYAHLNGFRRGQRIGTRVRQGQVIGYVGQTGWATGPHLHYEFRVNGVHRNPLTVKVPAAKPLAAEYMDDFKQKAAPVMAQLDFIRRFNVASLDTDIQQ